MLGIPILLVIVGVILLLSSKLVTKTTKRKCLTEYKRLLLGEFVFIAMIFSCTQVAFSLAVNIRYYVNIGIVTYLGFVLAGVYIIGLVGILVAFKYKGHEYFG